MITANFIINAQIESLAAFFDGLEDYFDQNNIGPSYKHKCMTALDEVLNNIIHYGLIGEPDATINITINISAVNIVMQITDSGVSYDILQQQPYVADAAIEERPQGGVGLLLVKNLMDTVDYQRKDNCNVTTLMINYDNK